MTEEEWLACEDPTPMLKFLSSKVNARKLKLFTCGCCRVVWSLLIDKRSRIALRRLEEYADDMSKNKLLHDLRNIANAAYIELQSSNAAEEYRAAACAIVLAAHPAIYESPLFPRKRDGNVERAIGQLLGLEMEAVLRVEVNLLHEVFGNPFRPITLSPTWLTSTVVSLAHQMYDSRDFSAMPILADALMDANCDNEDMLKHCRSETVHIRGCWIVDLILSK